MLQRQSVVIRMKCFFVTSNITERITAINVSISKIRLKCDRPIKTRKCIYKLLSFLKSHTNIIMHFGDVRIKRNDFLIDIQRLSEIVILSVTFGQHQQRFNIVRFDSNGFFSVLACFDELSLFY